MRQEKNKQEAGMREERRQITCPICKQEFEELKVYPGAPSLREIAATKAVMSEHLGEWNSEPIYIIPDTYFGQKQEWRYRLAVAWNAFVNAVCRGLKVRG